MKYMNHTGFSGRIFKISAAWAVLLLALFLMNACDEAAQNHGPADTPGDVQSPSDTGGVAVPGDDVSQADAAGQDGSSQPQANACEPACAPNERCVLGACYPEAVDTGSNPDLSADDDASEDDAIEGDISDAADDGGHDIGPSQGVECGGRRCAVGEICVWGRCHQNAHCVEDNDCDRRFSDICVDGACVTPTCDDGVQNGEETGVDCGGPDCPACEPEPECSTDNDCPDDSPSEWSRCEFPSGDICATHGHKSRVRSHGRCITGQCRMTQSLETEECIRETEGHVCDVDSCGDWTSCAVLVGKCDGTRTRQCDKSACSGGRCEVTSTIEAGTCNLSAGARCDCPNNRSGSCLANGECDCGCTSNSDCGTNQKCCTTSGTCMPLQAECLIEVDPELDPVAW